MTGKAGRSVVAALCLLGMCLAGVGCAPASAQSASVRMRGELYFDPSIVEVPVGGTITWENDGQRAHTVTAIDRDNVPTGRFDSGEVVGTGTFSHTFDEPGEYLYHCRIHADQEMVGLVVVTP